MRCAVADDRAVIQESSCTNTGRSTGASPAVGCIEMYGREKRPRQLRVHQWAGVITSVDWAGRGMVGTADVRPNLSIEQTVYSNEWETWWGALFFELVLAFRFYLFAWPRYPPPPLRSASRLTNWLTTCYLSLPPAFAAPLCATAIRARGECPKKDLLPLSSLLLRRLLICVSWMLMCFSHS